MTSPTAKTETRRKMRKVAMGNKRKNAVTRTGTTTQLFALNKPTDAEKSAKGGSAPAVNKKAIAPKATAKTTAAKKEKAAAAPKKTAAPKAKAAPKTKTTKAK